MRRASAATPSVRWIPGSSIAAINTEWRPALCAQFPEPTGDPATWTRSRMVYSWYHHPDYFCPEPYEKFPSAFSHIDLLPGPRGRDSGGT